MQAVLAGAAVNNSSRGEVVAVVGAKGGVGTTTIASHIAFDHLRAHPGEKVCLVDVDIEKGDVGAIFEARVDAHMRHHDRLRATYRPAVYEHEVAMGTSWPAQTLLQRALRARDVSAIKLLRRLPWRPAHLRQL